jgi:light-regulated signal transduction histidine kinase (bacteriophytochrome)
MQEIVEEVHAELDSHWTGPKVTWDIGHLPDVEGDPAMLRLVWVNLLSNAMKYSGKNPAPRISVHCVPNGTEEDVFSVIDNGAGFDMRYADKLFGVFQRLHSNQDYEGTGIGLAMIRRILERHGGRIWAESSVGHGASFYFILPTTKSAADKALQA